MSPNTPPRPRHRLRVLPFTERDIPAVAAFNHAAWTHGNGDVFKRDIFQPYKSNTPEARAIYERFYRTELEHADPTEHYVKVVMYPARGGGQSEGTGGAGTQDEDEDAGEGEIVACGCWAVYDVDPWSAEAQSRPKGRAVTTRPKAYWLEGRDDWADRKAFSEHLLGDLVQLSRHVEGITGRGRGHFHLHLIFTSPAHHRLGAGGALIRWGTSRADALRVPCMVFASEFAHAQRFYHGHGFRDVCRVRFNADGSKWPALPEARTTMMYRPVKGEEEDTGRWMGEGLVVGSDGVRELRD